MTQFKFSAGPWNIHEGADQFGPEVRKSIALNGKVKKLKELGFDAIQFHDDDAVPDMKNLSDHEIRTRAKELKIILQDNGMEAEFVAPRIWIEPEFVDGSFTSNDVKSRELALWRGYRSIDIANELGCRNIVLWLAREGTYVAESKNTVQAINWLIDGINKMLEYDKNIKILIEPKPNEPVDRSFCGTMGHVMGVSAATIDPSRVGGLLESAHAILAGLDPANEIAFGMAFGKLWGVHLKNSRELLVFNVL